VVDIEGETVLFLGGASMRPGCEFCGKNAELEGPDGMYVAGGGANGAPAKWVELGLKGVE